MDTRESVLTTKLYTIHEFANDTGLDLSLKQRLRNAIRYNS